MLCIQSPNTDIYFNLAAEEYLFKNFSDDIFMLWRNEPSIVVGKHQNTLAEINLDFVHKNRIRVARRLSGGGTVYHDEGNLNFTFITGGQEGKLVDFKRFITPIQELLLKLGVKTLFEGKNNLTVEGKKISGNAEHVYKNRVLHHGTLLFSSELANLSEALKVDQGIYIDKAVKSIRNPVTNINNFLNVEMNIEEFQDFLMNHILKENNSVYEFNSKDMKHIHDLVETKYNTWDWIYAYSPNYIFNKTNRFRSGELSVWLKVEKGLIKEAKINGDYFDHEVQTQLCKLIINRPHTLLTFTLSLESLFEGSNDTILTDQELISIFF